MRPRSALARFFAIGWATFQLALPSVTAVADGQLAAANATGPATHIEATTTERCPQAHSPDCAICRYLSGPAGAQAPRSAVLVAANEDATPGAATGMPHAGAVLLPRGRGPPLPNV